MIDLPVEYVTSFLGETMRLLRLAIAVQLMWALVIPLEVWSQAAQSAGQVSLVIPKVNVERGTQKLPAPAHTPVYWGDIVDTLRLGRARVALEDGSTINVGSESSFRITKHDAGAQQTEMELVYGRVRSQAVHLAKPDAKYEIRTRLGNAGVVGTDFFLAIEGDLLRLIVFEGVVRFCNPAGVCIDVAAGMMSAIRKDQQPDAAAPTPPALLTEAVNSTDVTPKPVVEGPRHHSPWLYVGLAIAAAIPGIVISQVGTDHTAVVDIPPPRSTCPPNNPSCRR